MTASNSGFSARLDALARPVFGSAAMRFVAYLGLCAAYLQGGLVKLGDFPGAIAEMQHFGLAPAPLFAVLVIPQVVSRRIDSLMLNDRHQSRLLLLSQ